MQAADLSSLLPLAVLALGIATVALIVGLLVYAHRARPAAGDGTPTGDRLDRPLLRRLRQDVGRAVARTTALTGAADAAYDVPWVLLVGFPGSRVGELATGLALAGGVDDADQPRLAELSVRICRDGFLLDMPDGLLERADWRSQWRSLLHSLATERPERPLDGVAVALAAADLVGPSRLSTAQLAARGEQLHELFWTLQRLTGFRVPVYLVLTGAESLQGFSAWTRAVPDAAREGLLGWPAPAAGDGPAIDHVDEALRALAARLAGLQLPLLMRGADPDLVDGLLLFPGELEQLAGPLAALLGPWLRRSAYHDGVFFRGCFVAGACGDGTPAFARGLFDRKIFAERSLAEPARGALGLRRRRIRLAQAALAAVVLLGTFGLVRLAARSIEVESVTQLLRTVDSEVTRVEQAAAGGGAGLHEIEAVAAGNLLRRMSNVSISSTETVKAPTSLLSGADERIERAIAVGYDVVVLQAVNERLLAKLDEILGSLDRAGAEVTPTIFGEAMRRLLEHEVNLRRYEQLGEFRVQALAGVANYALGISMPPQFNSHYRLYQDALADTAPPPIDRAALAQQVGQSLAGAWTALVEAHYRRSAVARAVERLTAAPAGGLDALAQLRSAASDLDRLGRTLDQPESAWLLSGTVELDGGLGESLVGIRDVATAWGPPLDSVRMVEQLRSAALAERAAARERLLTAPVFGTSPSLLQVEQRLELAPPLARARTAMAAYLDQPLLRDGRYLAVARPARSGERLIWDPTQLRELTAATEGSLLADTRDLAGLPPQLVALARRAGSPALAAMVEVALSRAQAVDSSAGWSADRGLQREVKAFAAAEPLLTALGQNLELAGLRDHAAALHRTVVDQARRLLAETDKALDRAAPYAMLDPGLGSWDGIRPLRLAAYGAASPAALAASLPGRRAFVERLAEDYASPLLGVLTQAAGGLDVEDEERVVRWSETLKALERFRRNDPSSSLSMLERFLTTGLEAVSPTSCGNEDIGFAEAWDYFADQLYDLRDAVAVRCEALASEVAASRYGQFASAFNAALAGRFPFTAAGAEAAAARRATYDDVRRFFRDHDEERIALTALLEAGLPAGVPAAAPAFLADVTAVRAALAPMIEPPVPAPLSYEVDAEFRAEPSLDRGGNQILEWSIETPAGRLSSLAGGGPLTWTAGQPVRVKLRWARNAPSLPVAAADGMPRLEGPAAIFEYRDPWALLSLLRVHTQPPADDGATFATLAFDVPLAPNPDAAPGGPAGLDEATVFLRLQLTALTAMPGEPVRRSLLPVPRFPAAAPDTASILTASPAPALPSPLSRSPAAGP